MTLATFVMWLVIAVVTGWAGGGVMKSGGHGMKADILLALTGSGLAAGVAAAIDLFPESGLAATAVVAFAGAGAALAVQRKWFCAPLGRASTNNGRG
jgi:uncharacterized membrane protein YeaQ/YmgE (transglycosylase-associated protein family)